ncbi:MAG: hypothetical protein MZV63_33950 [Marinilabiliales bacterium]|nr:hypothetical protein [Marinilabiliales bacterium]
MDLISAYDQVIAGAGLDVLTDEPPAFPLALAELDNVVLAAHGLLVLGRCNAELRRKASWEMMYASRKDGQKLPLAIFEVPSLNRYLGGGCDKGFGLAWQLDGVFAETITLIGRDSK